MADVECGLRNEMK